MAAIPRVRLGRSNLEVGRLALGAWGFQNPTAPDAASIDDPEEIRRVLATALAAGMDLVDSAEVYANEELLGTLLRDMPAPAGRVVVSTKFGHGKGFSGAQIRDSVERSLTAWGLDSIPLFMVHDPRNDEHLAEIAAPGGALPELRRLQDEGLVGSIGMATGSLPPLQAAVESDEWDVIQFPRLYTLLNDAALTSGLLEAAKAKDIGTILTSPFTGNILGTGVRRGGKLAYSFMPAIPEVVEAAGRIEDEAESLGIDMPTAALAFGLQQELIDVIVFGVTSVAELEADIAAVAAARTPEYAPERLARLVAAGAIDPVLLGGPSFTLPFPAERREAILAQR